MNEGIKLRAHQELAIEMCRDSMRRGNKRVVIAAPTSFGKTLTAIQIMVSAVERQKRVVFICDRLALIDQTLEACDAMGIQAGVIQGDHWRTDFRLPIQIASAQTLQRRIERWGTRMMDFDLVIHDECHTIFQWMNDIMARLSNVPWIGLSATPYAKGMGRHYQDLVVPITPRELLDGGYLTPVRYYGGASVDTKGIKTRRIVTGGSDFDPKALGEASEMDDKLTGDIVKNWIKYGENRQTVAFCPSIKLSKGLCQMFRDAGVSAEHIDGYADLDERAFLMAGHNHGEIKILSCSQLLNTGWDSPATSVLIDAYPTRSPTVYQQRIGRIMRTAPDKDFAVVLDHAGNFKRFGPAEDMVPESLDDGEKKYNERDQLTEKKEPKVRNCPSCGQQMAGLRCGCGYEVPMSEKLESDDTMLEELTAAKKKNREWTGEQKSAFLGELHLYAETRGFKPGWASNKYRDRFGVWPNKIQPARAQALSDDTSGWIKHSNIKWARRRTA